MSNELSSEFAPASKKFGDRCSITL